MGATFLKIIELLLDEYVNELINMHGIVIEVHLYVFHDTNVSLYQVIKFNS